MIPYIVYIVMTLILSIIYDGREDSRQKCVWYGLTCLYLILLAGLRNGVGGDTQFYMLEFDKVPIYPSDYKNYIVDNFEMHSFMPGWSILNILCKHFFDSFYAVQIIEAIIVNSCIFFIFHKYTSRIFLCALLFGVTGYFFIYNTEVMREAIAVSIGSIGMYQYLNGKKLFFYVTILIGLTFHISVLILIIFPLSKLIHSISIKSLISALSISFIIWLSSTILLTLIFKHFSGESYLIAKITTYSDVMSNIWGFLESALRYLVAQAGILLFAQFDPKESDQMRSHYSNIVGFYLMIATIVCAIPGTYRFINYTAIFSIVLVADFIGSLKYQLTNMALSKCIILLIFVLYSGKYYFKVWPNSQRHNYEFFVPYTSIVDQNVDTDYRYYLWFDAVHREKNQKNSRGL